MLALVIIPQVTAAVAAAVDKRPSSFAATPNPMSRICLVPMFDLKLALYLANRVSSDSLFLPLFRLIDSTLRGRG